MQQRSLAILKLIMGHQNIAIESLQVKTHLTRRQITYDIGLLNRWLEDHHYQKIENHNGVFKFNNNVNAVLADLAANHTDYILNEKERQQLIYLYLYTEKEMVSMYHLIDLLGVSRGTVNEDIKKLDRVLKRHQLGIQYTREKGYVLTGTYPHRLYFMMEIIVEIISFDQGHYLFQSIFNHVAVATFTKLQHYLTQQVIARVINISYNNINIISYIYTLHLMNGEQEPLEQHPILFEEIRKLPEHQLAKTIIEQESWRKQDIPFLTTLLLAYSIGQDNRSTADYPVISAIIDEMLIKLKQSYTIKLGDQKVFTQLYSHIRPALYRMVYQYPMINPIKEEIITQYNFLYVIIEELFSSLDFDIQSALTTDELAYLTIHFETFLSKEQHEKRAFIRGVIVCPSGIGISVLLYQQLTRLFPNIVFSHSVSVYEFKNLQDEVDIVFSTLLIETDKPLFLVTPIMNSFEKAELVNNVYREFHLVREVGHPLDRLLKQIERYAEIKDKEGLVNELSLFLSEKTTTQVKRRQPMLGELLDEETIQLNVSAHDWREAIEKSALPLLKTGKITKDYIQAIIRNVEETGPYIVIIKHVALPHARPSDGAKDVGLALMTLAEPVIFGHEQNDPVKYIFCLSAIDNTTHLQALSELVDFLGDDQFYHLMDQTDSPKEILAYIKDKEEK